MVLTADEGKKVQQLFESRELRRAGWTELGETTECLDAPTWHQQRVMELTEVPRIQQRRPGVFLDANGGAGGPLGRSLLQALGCAVVCEGCTADGVFRHEPEPIAENLHDVCAQVPAHRADLGFVLDPDADRLAIIDERGQYIGEELTLALVAQFRLRQERVRWWSICPRRAWSRTSPPGSTVRLSARLSARPMWPSAVREMHAVLGGEGNGGVIDPHVGYVRDPFIGMALVLSLLAESTRPLSSLVAELPTYAIVKDKYTVNRNRLSALFRPAGALAVAKIDLLDGLRLDWNDRWVHVRPSNTEPIVRVIAEAPREADARQLCQEVGQLLRLARQSSHNLLVTFTSGVDDKPSRSRARWFDADPQPISRKAAFDPIGPFDQANTIAGKILVHHQFRELRRPVQPIGVEMINRQTGLVFLDQYERWTADNPAIGDAQAHGDGATSCVFPAPAGHTGQSRSRQTARRPVAGRAPWCRQGHSRQR